MLYLASRSPRRGELLHQMGVEFSRIEGEVDETPKPGESIESLVVRLSIDKALAGLRNLAAMQTSDLVLASDTLIGIDGQVVGKPRDPDHCQMILSRLSAREHQVYTAVALVNHTAQVRHRLSINRIRFRQLTEAEIRLYCESPEPADKAGAYAIQGRAAMFIEHMQGSYSSVMGLPIFETAELLMQAGYQLVE